MVRDSLGKRRGFTLIEVLAAVALSGLILVGALGLMTNYMMVWREVPKAQREHDKMISVTRMVLNEISSSVRRLSRLQCCPQMTFKKLSFTPPNTQPGVDRGTARVLGASQILEGDDPKDIAFYFQSYKVLPFVDDSNGGIVEYFLKFINNLGLYIFWRSLNPGDKPFGQHGEIGTGRYSRDLKYVRLLDEKHCKGLNFVITDVHTKELIAMGTPTFSNGRDPDLPEALQFITKNG